LLVVQPPLAKYQECSGGKNTRENEETTLARFRAEAAPLDDPRQFETCRRGSLRAGEERERERDRGGGRGEGEPVKERRALWYKKGATTKKRTKWRKTRKKGRRGTESTTKR
jgi:hypothetical protein